MLLKMDVCGSTFPEMHVSDGIFQIMNKKVGVSFTEVSRSRVKLPTAL